MIVELIGGPFDGQTRDIPETERSIWVIFVPRPLLSVGFREHGTLVQCRGEYVRREWEHDMLWVTGE